MLVLTRKVNEKIIIGPLPEGLPPGTTIEIKVTQIQGGRARIGVTCPIEIRVDRLEARQRLERGLTGEKE